MKPSILFIWLTANILFFAVNYFMFHLLNGKLWKTLNDDAAFSKSKFVFVFGNALVAILMFVLMVEPISRVVDLCSKNQILTRELIDFIALSLGFSVLWNVVSDRFSKLLLEILTKRKEIIESTTAGSYFFITRMCLYLLVAIAFSPIILAFISSLIPQINLPNIIR